MFLFKKSGSKNDEIEEMRQKNQNLEKKMEEMQQNKNKSAQEVKKIAAKNIELEEKVRRMDNLLKKMEIDQPKKGSSPSNPFLAQPSTSAVNAPTWNKGGGVIPWGQSPPNAMVPAPNAIYPRLDGSGVPPPWAPMGPMSVPPQGFAGPPSLPPQPFHPMNNEVPMNQPPPPFLFQNRPNQLNSGPSNQQAPMSNLQNRNQGAGNGNRPFTGGSEVTPQPINAANLNRTNGPRNSPQYQPEWKNRNEYRPTNSNDNYRNKNLQSRFHNETNRQDQFNRNERNPRNRAFPNDSTDHDQNRSKSQNRPLFRGRGNRGRSLNRQDFKQQNETKDERENNQCDSKNNGSYKQFDNRGRGGHWRARGKSHNSGQERNDTEEKKEFHHKKHKFVRGGVNKRYEDKGKLRTSDLDSDTESFEELSLNKKSNSSDSGNDMEVGRKTDEDFSAGSKTTESKVSNQRVGSKPGNKPSHSRNENQLRKDFHQTKHGLVRGRIQKRHHDRRKSRSSDVDSDDLESTEYQKTETLLDVGSPPSKSLQSEDNSNNSNEGACGGASKKHLKHKLKKKHVPKDDAGCSGEPKKDNPGQTEIILSKNNMGENNLLEHFIGSNIPSLLDALSLTSDLETRVANVLLLSDPDKMAPIFANPKTLADIVNFKTKYPNAKSILL